MYYILYTINALLMIVLPLVLAAWIDRHYDVDWGLFGAGAATFIGAQLLHIPFNWLVDQSGLLPDPTGTGGLLVVALFLGLSAGLFEEVARYLTYRFWAPGARSWSQGLMLGAGHGGIESILLGLLVAVNLALFFGLPRGLFQGLVPEGELPQLLTATDALFAAPLYDTLLGALERLLALVCHLALSLLVMQSLVRHNGLWLLAAIGWHAVLDSVAVFSAAHWNVYVSQAAIAVIALASLGIILRLRLQPSPEVVEASGPAEPPPLLEAKIAPRNTARRAERLEESKYQ